MTSGVNPSLGSRDEGTVLYDSLRITRGEVMYRDFFEFQGPVFYYLFGGLFRAIGPSIVAARVVENVIAAMGAALLAWVVSRRAGRLAGVGAAAFYTGVLIPAWPCAYPHWLAQTLVLGALALLAVEDPSPRRLRGAGALLALAVATIQSLGLPALVAAVVAGAMRRRARDVLVGAAAVLVPLGLAFAVAGALGPLLHDMFVWPFSHYAAGQTDAPRYGSHLGSAIERHAVLAQPWRALAGGVLCLIVALPLVAVAGAAAAIGRDRRQLALPLVTLAVVAPLFVGVVRGDVTHIAFVGALALVGAALPLAFFERLRRHGGIALCVVGLAGLASYAHKVTITWAISRQYATFSEAFVSQLPFAKLVAQRTKPGDQVVIGEAAGWTYWVTDHRTPVSYTFIPHDPAAYEGYFTGDMWQKLADEIVTRRPGALGLTDGQWERLVSKRADLRHAYVQRFNPMFRVLAD